MNHDPQQPASQTPTVTPLSGVASRRRTKLALWLLIGPTALVILTIALYATVNFIDGDGDPGMLHVLVNIIMFILGLIGVLAWLPGIIIGIVLQATRK